MTEDRKLTFAPFVAAACALWIFAAATGSQAFTMVILLLAVASFFFTRPSYRLPAFSWALVAALAWISVSSLWSPASSGWVSGSLKGEDFAIDVASIRLIGAAILSALAINAALQVPVGRADKTTTALLIIIATMIVFIIGVFVFRDEILAFAYPDEPEKALRDGVQNVQRAANSVAVILPIGLAAAWIKFTSAGARVSIAATGMVTLVVFQLLGSQSAVASFVIMLGAFASVRWLGVGTKALLRLLAVYVLFAPVVMFVGTRIIGAINLRLPESFQSRVYCWHETLAKIMERPFTGHGLEASGTWKETYAGRTEWVEKLTSLAGDGQAEAMNKAWQNFPIIPGHPHNMALELWAETGVVGALLVAVCLWLVASRLTNGVSENRTVTYTSAGLIGAALPLFSFAYSAWNEAYWCMIAVAICAVIVQSKRSPS